MKQNKFRNLCKKYSVCDNAKFVGILPAIILITAIVLIVVLGLQYGSFSDGVGIGIDFEGGTILTVTLGQDALDHYDANREKSPTSSKMSNTMVKSRCELLAIARGKRQEQDRNRF